ncbi:MAG: alanine-tRNA synthetase second additional domain-containing protein [Clostridia bacterium]|nr:alanine-tRNA synthetase second additional domain-containing protein [Clostridia bacterium]
MAYHRMQQSLILASFFAPRGQKRIYDLGMQIAQLYLTPFDKLIGIIGDAGSGKSALVKGMFPGLELTNDDDGVNVRPLPLLDINEPRMGFNFYTPHTYHLDIRFETGFTQPHVLAEAIMEALHQGKRVVVEHFDLIYPLLPRNADLMIGVGEQVLVTRPTIFGPEPDEFTKTVHSSLHYRLMAHTAEDLCEMHMEPVLVDICKHDDIHHGFVLAFKEMPPLMDLIELERKVNEDIAADLPVHYHDENHIAVGDRLHECSGPRTHVSTTGKIKGFRLHHEIVYDNQMHRYLLVGFVGEDSEENLKKFQNRKQFIF